MGIMPIKTAVGYVRTSGLINPKASIPNQMRLIEEYCKKENFVLKRFYIDEAISGTSIQERYAYQELRRELINGQKVDCVLSSFSNRLGREMYEFTTMVLDLQGLGVDFISISDGLKASEMNPTSLAVTAIMVEMENVQRTKSITHGKLRTVASGKFPFQTPYGYKKNKGYLEINKEESHDIRFIFQSFIKGKNISEILTKLNQEQKLRSDGTPWNYGHVYSILKNRNYTGTYYKKLPNSSEVEKVPTVTFPAYITEDEFGVIQEKLKIRKRDNKNTAHLLSGIYYCPICKSTVYGIKGLQEYACKNRCEVYNKNELEKKVLVYLANNKKDNPQIIGKKDRKNKLLEDKEDLELRFVKGNIGIQEYFDKIEVIKMELEEDLSNTFNEFTSENNYDYYIQQKDYKALRKLLKINKVRLTLNSKGQVVEMD
jgi:site-specific DNA recombinase